MEPTFKWLNYNEVDQKSTYIGRSVDLNFAFPNTLQGCRNVSKVGGAISAQCTESPRHTFLEKIAKFDYNGPKSNF